MANIGFKTFPWGDVEFDDYETTEGSPRIYHTPEGNFPSMTSVLSVLKDGGIERWRERVGAEEADRICREAVDRGNSLHDLNELYLMNKLTRDQIRGDGKVLFNRVKRYLDEVQLVLGTEVALYNKDDGYAGRTDAIVLLEDHLTILDHKNSRNPISLDTKWGRKKLFKYFLQLKGYGRALYKTKGLLATRGCLVVGNHSTSTADRFVVDLTDPYWDMEFDTIIRAYYNKGDVSFSSYFTL